MQSRRKSRTLRMLAFALLFLNLHFFAAHQTAHAHNWGSYHWNKGGSNVRIRAYWAGGSYFADANAAMQDMWNKVPILYNLPWLTSHTEISVFDGAYGSTGWCGLAELTDLDWDWGTWWWTHIGHGHARYNTSCGYGAANRRGVFCQEIWHTYGFQHNNTGSCMGLGYFAGATTSLNAHDATDFNNRYRNH